MQMRGWIYDIYKSERQRWFWRATEARFDAAPQNEARAKQGSPGTVCQLETLR
jgi:hypothetical protein